MKRLALAVIIICVVISVFACRENVSSLIKNAVAYKSFEEHCKKYDYAYHQRKGDEIEEIEQRDGRDYYDQEEWDALTELIKKYPNTTTSLSAKLLLCEIKEKAPLFRPEALRMYQDIIENYPDSWQSIYAIWRIGQMHYQNARGSKERELTHEAIKYHLRYFDLYRKLDKENDPELWLILHNESQVWWSEPEAFSAEVLLAMAAHYETFSEDQHKVRPIYEQIVREYPGTFEAKQAKMFLGTLDDFEQRNKIYKWFRETYGQPISMLLKGKLASGTVPTLGNAVSKPILRHTFYRFDFAPR